MLADLGCVVEDAEPDWRNADAIFQIVRAWGFESGLGALLDEHRAQMKDTVVWNIEQGRKLSGAQVAWAERERTALYERVSSFMGRYEFLALPVTQLPPFDVETPYPTEINGVPMATYVDWMRSCSYISLTGLPAMSVPCGFTPEGLPVGLQLVARHQDEFGQMGLSLNKVLDLMSGTKLDLTDTASGGNTVIARAIMGWFVNAPSSYQVHRSPEEERRAILPVNVRPGYAGTVNETDRPSAALENCCSGT
mgnify:CR=1 FL=1